MPELAHDEKFDWASWEQHRRQSMEMVLLPFWQGMGSVYAAILADNEGDASVGMTLAATIEDWPKSFVAQQHTLVELMNKSKLRQALLGLAPWQKADADSARPMREIPLYWHGVRASCQQVICMPVRQWDAMFTETACYAPSSVDEDIVEMLATRIARALNVPLQTGENLNAAPNPPVVWMTSPFNLLRSIDSHGMTDRMFDEYLRPIEHESDRIPGWRFDGFCGQLRVLGIADEPWYVTVLAPAHFVGTLMNLVRECEQ